ncbi:MAG: T9SS type A sorting domain-containing protein, partial [Ignavibacteriaceae bacterium]|nr:T9SS type A sorting domain-containing protein [Ignavibacteriaceae bacterium]
MSFFTKKTLLIMSVVLFSATLAYSQVVPDFNWAKPVSSTGKDYGRSLIADPMGNVYTTGYYQNTGDFGNGVSLTSFGNYDYYLAKFDILGNAVWARGGGGTLTDRGFGVVLDPDGNVLVTGHLFGTANFSDSMLTSAGNLDLFTAKYDTAGNLLWIKQGFSVSQLSPHAIAVDAAGNSAVACYFGSSSALTATFGSVTVTTHGNRDAAVVKYDANGNVLWAESMGGLLSTEESNDVCFDPAGNVYVTGRFNTEANFGAIVLTGNGGTDAFIAKYDPNGNVLWAKSAGGPLGDAGQGITYANGHIYVAGTFDSAATFGAFNLTVASGLAGDEDIFYAVLDLNGNFINAYGFGGPGDDNAEDIVSDAAGYLYMVGEFQATANFNANILTSAGDDDAFMMKIAPNNDILWVKQAGGLGTEKGYGAACDLGGNFLATGNFQQVASFGTIQLTSGGSEDIYITKIGDNPVPVELASFNATVAGHSVNLNWITATETNNSGFAVERKDDNESFHSVAFIKGNGTTTSSSNYSFNDENLKAGKYSYRLKQIDFNGSSSYSKIVEVEITQPSEFVLNQNYPNPFNPSTVISFELPVEANVTVTIFNSLGEEVSKMVKGMLTAGHHQLTFDAHNLSSGVY